MPYSLVTENLKIIGPNVYWRAESILLGPSVGAGPLRQPGRCDVGRAGGPASQGRGEGTRWAPLYSCLTGM
jgi:hypothetical protein